MKDATNWYSKPSKKQIVIVLTVWIIMMALVVHGTTDGFKVGVPANILLLAVLPSLAVVLTLLKNYNRQRENHKS